jgi:CubicO group peptidase (beta-lactamase class C family)
MIKKIFLVVFTILLLYVITSFSWVTRIYIAKAVSTWQEVDLNSDNQINSSDIDLALNFIGCPEFGNCSSPSAGQMVFPGVDWQTVTPESQDIDSALLNQAVNYLTNQSNENGTDELMIIRNGYVVYQGSDTERVHPVWSVTKAFLSTSMGLLSDDNLLSPNDYAYQSVPVLLQQYPQATLGHFASFTSGYDAEGWTNLGYHPRYPDFGDESLTPWIPTTPMFAPGTAFTYWDDSANMLGYILTQVAGEDLESLFTRRIANPIQMNSNQWFWNDFGVVDGYTLNGGSGTLDAGINISARQLARLGHLYLNSGNWNGQQLLTSSWISEATQNHVNANFQIPGSARAFIDGRGIYGYHWWMNGIKNDGTRNLPDAPLDTYFRTGFMHNMLFVIPQWQMVIVRLGTDENPDDRIGVWNNFLDMVDDAITGDVGSGPGQLGWQDIDFNNDGKDNAFDIVEIFRFFGCPGNCPG